MQPLKLKRGRLHFGHISASWQDRAIVLSLQAKTEAPNVFWVRFIVIRIGWPPISTTHAFMDKDEATQ